MTEFWNNKRVFITGHTGFKGSWLSLWLTHMGAKVAGYALQPPTSPSLFELCNIEGLLEKSTIADIRDLESIKKAVSDFKPEIVIHMAAQPLVRDSYKIPVETYSINVMGTVNVFEAIRTTESVKAVVNVTTDKCYENKEWEWGYRENERLGGYDPYSNSKACSELVTSAYRNSFFNPEKYNEHGVAIASARAGNVIGGGDWAVDRLIPDCVRSLLLAEEIVIRNPNSIRPWQHVLEPLSGYLLLAEKLYMHGVQYAEGWNFGPSDNDAKPVSWIVDKICDIWGESSHYRIDGGSHPHEAHYLKLDCSKAKSLLNWQPRWELERTLKSIVYWSQMYNKGADMRITCLEQINDYVTSSDL
ncbi:CDP-glucose 4,6-dehydratase [Paenibacillus allorhizoplanae]|uniref:CDP-glucose 4,6-dehydratase n=1 Tax=Paenibacillus allorhizoplanae TaxID=2905648 RepID=A0ABN8GGH7_9BACL|nr:CDP-glucose 4,6-dehydratase [Paenibacillus allorhizoplanae]CAH1208477.1 CDP-glucose 4,6-dehydratase [Paenibacillus allorhizoplanae]